MQRVYAGEKKHLESRDKTIKESVCVRERIPSR